MLTEAGFTRGPAGGRDAVQPDPRSSPLEALLRAEAGRDPYDRPLTDLIGELSTRSEEFRVRWAAHNVRFHRSGVKRFHHPLVGDLTLTYERLELPADPEQSIFVYTAERTPRHTRRSTSWRAGPRHLLRCPPRPRKKPEARAVPEQETPTTAKPLVIVGSKFPGRGSPLPAGC
jgi:hypothetical protein